MKNIKIGFAMCGSFCTFSQILEQMKALKEANYDVLPILSEIAYTTDTRFGKAKDIIKRVEEICERKALHTQVEVEPIGPKKMADIFLIAPCTGNTLSKLNNAITDTTVTLAAKSHLRGGRPLLIALATNDALGGSAKNFGAMLNKKNVYFVPLSQDDPQNKPNSLVADFNFIIPTIELALQGEQIQPLLM